MLIYTHAHTQNSTHLHLGYLETAEQGHGQL